MIRTSLIIILLSYVFLNTSCSDEDNNNSSGNLTVTFSGDYKYNDIEVDIYKLDSLSNYIHVYNSKLTGYRKLDISLNLGEYVIVPRLKGNYTEFNRISFQVQQGKTTMIEYDVTNIGKIIKIF